jgi:hypothetical protein
MPFWRNSSVSASAYWHRLGQFVRNRPRSARFLDRILRPVERVTKGAGFGCHMCGQCVLHSTGMVCPMNCPKNLRNGPCGGVRLDGSCEVYPEMECVWVTAYARSQRLFWPEEIHDLRPPVDWSLEGSASWVNALTGRDQVVSGCAAQPDSALDVVAGHGN